MKAPLLRFPIQITTNDWVTLIDSKGNCESFLRLESNQCYHWILLLQKYNQPTNYYKGNMRTPIFQEGRKERITPTKAMEILADCNIDVNLKCSKVPLRVRTNKTFLMDTNKFKNWEDIKNDMNGTYPSILRTCTWTVEIQKDESLKVETCKVIAKTCQKIQQNDRYHLKFNSKKNHAGLCRSIFLLFDKNGDIVNNTCLLQYHITTGEDTVEFQVQSHGVQSVQSVATRTNPKA